MLATVKPVTFSMHFRGRSVAVDPGVLTAQAYSPSTALVTRIDRDGLHASIEEVGGDEAHLECRLTMLGGDRYEEVGTISFGSGNAIRFRTVVPGNLVRSPDARLRHGCSSWEVDGGAGAFAGASGRIVSNLLVSDDGDLTDHQLGLLFVADDRDQGERNAGDERSGMTSTH